MHIEVERIDPEDKFRRKVWFFDYNDYHRGLRLVRYAEQTRQSNRHKWQGDVWNSYDERPYISKLPRPVEIPGDIIKDAYNQILDVIINRPVYIGWFNDKNLTVRNADFSNSMERKVVGAVKT